MKLLLTLTATVLSFAPVLSAQQTLPAGGTPPAGVNQTANPIVWSANQMYSRSAKNMVAAAEEMPADKYAYSPTPGQMTFGQLVSHVAHANEGVCGILSGVTPPARDKAPQTGSQAASKPSLLAALQSSFDFCGTALANLQDAQLGQQVTFFRGARVPRARALFELTGDLEDHYSQMAGYLRLNNLLPPSAQPRK